MVGGAYLAENIIYRRDGDRLGKLRRGRCGRACFCRRASGRGRGDYRLWWDAGDGSLYADYERWLCGFQRGIAQSLYGLARGRGCGCSGDRTRCGAATPWADAALLRSQGYNAGRWRGPDLVARIR